MLELLEEFLPMSRNTTMELLTGVIILSVIGLFSYEAYLSTLDKIEES